MMFSSDYIEDFYTLPTDAYKEIHEATWEMQQIESAIAYYSDHYEKFNDSVEDSYEINIQINRLYRRLSKLRRDLHGGAETTTVVQ